MAGPESPEYKTICELENFLQTGLKSDIDSVAVAAFSYGLITSNEKDEFTMQTNAAHKRAKAFLSALEGRIYSDPANLNKFILILKHEPAYKPLVKKIEETLKGKKEPKRPPVPDFDEETKDVFLSYSWEVKSFADGLAACLKQKGVTVWIDDVQVHTGDDLDVEIVEGINNSKVFVAILSEAYLSEKGRRWCIRELKWAKDKNKEIFAICWNNVHITDEIKFIVGASNLRRKCNPDNVDEDIQTICQEIERKVQSIPQ